MSINWRYTKTNPPTKSDAGDSGLVIVPSDVDEDGFEYRHYQCCDEGLWVSMAEFKAHIESTLNPLDSPWVFVKDQWPTELDGQHILWMADSWSQPGVHLLCAFSQASHCYRHNLRWMRIPPCPDPPKRELPAVSPIYDGDDAELARHATLRDGTHVHILELVGNAVYMVVRQRHSHQIIVNRDGHFLADKSQHECDVVHVGGWLTAEELDALKNGNRGDA